MPHGVARRRARLPLPARAGALARGVEAAAVDDHVRVPGVGVDRDVAAGPGGAVGHELARVLRRAQEAAAVERVGHGARAVVARVVEARVPAAVAVGLVGDPARGGDHAPDGDRQAAAGAAARAATALEHAGDAGVAERGPRRGADDAVGGQAVAALEALDGAQRARAEDSVGGDAERALQGVHGAAAGPPGAARAPAGALERLPRRGADDAVGGQAVAALEAPDGALGLLAVDAVDVQAEDLLHERDARALGAALEVASMGVRRGAERQREDRRHDYEAQAPPGFL